MNRYSKLSFLVRSIAAESSVTYAASQSWENNAAAIAKAKIPLNQAVTVAEQHTNGMAARAE